MVELVAKLINCINCLWDEAKATQSHITRLLTVELVKESIRVHAVNIDAIIETAIFVKLDGQRV